MKKADPCCQFLPFLAPVESPFTKIVALGFYDGPTSGILRCGACQADYRFDMLDWDEDHEVRVWRLAPLPLGTLEQCAIALSSGQSPRWPVWVPPGAVSATIDDAVRRILDLARPAELIVACTAYGDKVLAAQRMPPKELADVPDWFSQANPRGVQHWFPVLSQERS